MKVHRLQRQRYLQAKKIVYTVRWGIETIDELNRLEAEKTEAKYIYIAEQSAEVVYQSFPNISSSIKDQEAQLHTRGKVGVFDQSFIANNISN